MELLETHRLKVVQDTLKSFSKQIVEPVKALQGAQTKLQLVLEAFRPDKEFSTLIEQNMTGMYHIPPISLESSLFGSKLEEQSQNSAVPPIVSKCVDLIESYISKYMNPLIGVDFWLETTPNMKQVFEIRNKLTPDSLITLDNVSPSIVVGVFKTYLQELPISVCCHEIYEPLKLLYLSSKPRSAITLFLTFRIGRV
jgi:hypothetical protein